MIRDDHAVECGRAPAIARRGFIRLAALGAGAALLGLPPSARAAGDVEALVITCMDYRLVDEAARYLEGRGLTNRYDLVILAGASLAAVTDAFPAWNKTFWEHVGVAIDLHKVKKLIVIDHRDCGAYKVVFKQDFGKDPAADLAKHREVMQKMAGEAKRRHPTLELELLLMSLDGKVETIA